MESEWIIMLQQIIAIVVTIGVPTITIIYMIMRGEHPLLKGELIKYMYVFIVWAAALAFIMVG